jgi:glycosyltransferase 2 family protein
LKKRLKILLGLIISIGLIIYLLHKIDIRSVKQSLLSFNYLTIILFLFVFVAGMLSRSLRWQNLIRSKENLPLFFVFKALSIGYMINNLLPAKVGEFARMEYIKRKKGISRSFLLGTIFMERFIDVILVLFIFGISLAFSQAGRAVFIQNKWTFIALLLLVIIVVLFLSRPVNFFRLLAFFPKKAKLTIEKVLLSFTESIHFISNRNLLIRVSFYSMIIWMLTLFTSYLILRGLNVYLPFYGYFFVVAVGVLGLVIPSTSGGIGVFHAIATAALVLLGVTPEKALAYAIIAHAFDFIPNVFIGLAIFVYEGLTFKNLYASGNS